ncbi:psp operon transcriptional activator [Desulfonatronum thiosulfatophilum]|uniref:Psp operon transcriptional activator n=1 Tax=Desulfonatronum thiosulfatophilum TaxID=617002 RepID=A0A1G6D2U0_9BACT|nr:phage shock protein operon transcriptional activator [Desulfonatronum thiosulfatophilum]SDB39401.1 psp operon transcriptional activator [Desulfonatronum thiosulfatophilum]
MAIITKTHSLFSEALGRSDAFLSFQEQLGAVAKVDRPVVIIGERGSGKELAAVRLHYHSTRWQAPLVTVNCAALSESLLESELFGHEPGAFTGAIRLRTGRFESAHQGTLFLDEIGTMPLTMQEKILRVVEYQVVERLGGSRPMEVDVRIVAATNANLKSMAESGRFKDDLLDRLAFEVLHVPPLREREGDVLLLAEHFAARMAVELGLSTAPRFSKKVLEILEGYPWPGNVRELKSVVERAVFRAKGSEVIRDVVVDPFARTGRKVVEASMEPSAVSRQENGSTERGAGLLESMNLPDALADLERRYLEHALRQARFNQRKAAKILGLRYHQFRGLYRKHSQVQAELNNTDM